MLRSAKATSGIRALLLLAGALAMSAIAARADGSMMGQQGGPMMARAPQGSAGRGAEIFQRCAICHNADKGGGNGLGPNLFGVAGRKAASLPDFPYSAALRNSKIVWTDDKLKAWVSGPSKLVPGTRMAFAGLANPKDADDVIAYLHSRR